MVGFSGVLKADHQSKFTFICCEERPSSYRLDYLSTLLKNYTQENTSCIHLVSFVFRNLSSKFDPSYNYDFVGEYFPGLDIFYADLKKNMHLSKRNILIIDDMALLYIYTERASKEISRFFQQLSKCFTQIFLFAQLDTLTNAEISLICSLTETFVVLKNSDGDNSQEFLCSQLIMKPSGKTSLDQSYFEIRNGQLKDSPRKVNQNVLAQKDNSEDIMRSLTTFKLTIEEDEKESKNRLYLPYLDAQRTTVPDPSEDFYDDDDEDDD